MEISSVANQAIALKDQMTNNQLGVAAIKMAADSEKKMAEMLAQNAASVRPAQQAEQGGFSTYA